MKIIKVDATTSTNELSKTLNSSQKSENFCVCTEYQSEGKGQKNNLWQSNKSENLMFTVVFNNLNLQIDERFVLNALVCLSIYKSLEQLNIKDFVLKWPNDILAEKKKIGGILIENSIVRDKIKTSYIGIGVNVNQKEFDDLPKASSISLILDKIISREALLDTILEDIKDLPSQLKINNPQNVIDVYKRYLLGFNVYCNYELPTGKLIKAKIVDITLVGHLVLKLDSGEILSFGFKEIKQIY